MQEGRKSWSLARTIISMALCTLEYKRERRIRDRAPHPDTLPSVKL